MARLTATFQATRTEDGGRRNPIHTGYRAAWLIPQPDGEERFFDGPIEIVGTGMLNPGETGQIRIMPVSPEYWNHITVGTELSMFEGSMHVGTARVIGIDWNSETSSEPS